MSRIQAIGRATGAFSPARAQGDNRHADYPGTEPEAERNDVQAAAKATGQQLIIVDVASVRDVETAITTLVQRGVDALFVGAGAFLFSNQERVVALAARHALPATYSQREFVTGGGLMSYGSNQS